MLRGLAVLLVQLLITPPFALAGIAWHLVRPRDEAVPRVGQAWARIVLRVAGIRVRAIGLERARSCRPAVVVGNHSADVDSFAAAVCLERPFRYVAKSSLFRIPFFGHALRAAGFVPVDRVGRRSDIDRLEKLQEDLAGGAVVVFFPEGSRSRDGRLRPFRKGAFVTAILAGVPVLPMVIRGAHALNPAGTIRYRPGTVEVEFLPPIPTDGLTYDDRDRLIEETWTRFRDSLPPDQQPHPGTAAPRAAPS